MSEITLIAAIGKNNELGLNNDLIWHLKEDLQFFKEQTTGKKIIMGYNTLMSLPKKLSNRKYLVLTHRNILDEEISVFNSIDELLQYLNTLDEEVMVIGGARIYEQMIKYASKLLLTEIDCFHEADVYFPIYNKDDYYREIIKELEENNIKYKHVSYTRKKVK